MFENYTEPLLSRLQFAWRISKALSVTVLLAAISVCIGTLGYHLLAGCEWSDAFHLACLILGSHDISLRPESTAGGVFAGLYVMYARLVFVSILAILAAPLLHRILHSLHLDPAEDGAQVKDHE